MFICMIKSKVSDEIIIQLKKIKNGVMLNGQLSIFVSG